MIGAQSESFTYRTIFRSKSHPIPNQWERNTKTKKPVRLQGLFKVTNEIAGKREAKKAIV